jgi:hypothetical protein
VKFHGNVDLPAGGSASLRTLIVENLGLSPPFVATEKGRLYFNTSDNSYYFNNGVEWTQLTGGGGGSSTTSPPNWQVITADQTISAGLAYLVNGGGSRILTLPSEINQGDQYIVKSTSTNVTILANGNLISQAGAGNNLTITDGETAWLVASSANVLEVVDAAYLFTGTDIFINTQGNINLSGRVTNYAALPSSATNGSAYLNDGDGLVYVYSSGWPVNGAGLRLLGTNEIVPKTSTFSGGLGSGGCTITDKSDRLQFIIPNTVMMHALSTPISAAPYTIETHVQLLVKDIGTSTDALVVGLFISNGTQMRTCTLGYWPSQTGVTTRMSIDSWTSPTTFGSQISFQTPVNYSVTNIWIRITDDGTSRRFYISSNGSDWQLHYTEATNTYVTPTVAGICTHNIGVGTQPNQPRLPSVTLEFRRLSSATQLDREMT